MEIREYTELPQEAKQIRTTVFVEEQGFKNELDEIDNRAIHLVMFDEDCPIACCRVFQDDSKTTWRIGRMAVVLERRGCGLGSQLVQAAEQCARKNGADKIVLGSQMGASGFYARLGYESYGEPYMDEDCPHTMMRKTL